MAASKATSDTRMDPDGGPRGTRYRAPRQHRSEWDIRQSDHPAEPVKIKRRGTMKIRHEGPTVIGRRGKGGGAARPPFTNPEMAVLVAALVSAGAHVALQAVSGPTGQATQLPC
jgi:hypothetical protein